jgi:hypothetical protein
MNSVKNILEKKQQKRYIYCDVKLKNFYSRFVLDVIKQHGYKPLFITPYKLFLNPKGKNVVNLKLRTTSEGTHSINLTCLYLLLSRFLNRLLLLLVAKKAGYEAPTLIGIDVSNLIALLVLCTTCMGLNIV